MFRIQPSMPVGAMKTYRILQPVQTHFRPATCEEADCDAHANGWRTTVDLATELGQRQAEYITKKAGRRFTKDQNGKLLTFTFEPGQPCFRAADHRVALEREPIYIARDGDWRGNPTGRSIKHTSAEHWVEDFAANQDAVKRAIEEG